MSEPAAFCAGEPPHPLAWLTPDFAYCPACELLYARQPGALVWVYDLWSMRLAEALAEANYRLELARLGLDAAAAAALAEGVVEPA